MGRRRVLAVAAAAMGVVSLMLGGTAAGSVMRQVRFTATLDGSMRTTWSVPEQLLSSTCYDDMWQQGEGTEHMTLHMSETHALGVVYGGKSLTLSLGSWQLYHGTAHGRENVTRQGQTTTFHRPGNCGLGGTAPATHDGPGGCGNRTGTPQVSLSSVGSKNTFQLYVSDTRSQIKPYSDCPVFYGSLTALPDGFSSPVLGRVSAKDVLNKKKRDITVRFKAHWHHGRGNAVTNYYIADTTAYWTLELTRQR